VCVKKEAGVFLLGNFSKQTDVEKNFLPLIAIREVILFNPYPANMENMVSS